MKGKVFLDFVSYRVSISSIFGILASFLSRKRGEKDAKVFKGWAGPSPENTFRLENNKQIKNYWTLVLLANSTMHEHVLCCHKVQPIEGGFERKKVLKCRRKFALRLKRRRNDKRLR
jgi:hypothetical protein